MKKLILIMSFACFSLLNSKVIAQSEEVQQLLLNVEKLAQLKEVLNGLYKSYEVLHNGYTTIQNLSEGNFNLHKQFLDKLQQASPVVRQYKKVADIVSYQMLLVKEYKQAFSRFKADEHFAAGEIKYISGVYSQLVDESLKNMDALAAILTAGSMRMSDDERLERIDKLFDNMQDKLSFLRHFNKQTTLLAIQRAREKNDIQNTQKIYRVTP